MSTSNFHNVNASKIFAVDIEDHIDYDDLEMNVAPHLDNLNATMDDPHELRSYPSKVIGAIESYRRINETDTEADDLTVTLYAVIRSGYYSGVCLDWLFNIDRNGEDYDNYEDFANDVRNDEELNVNEKTNILTWVQLEGGKLQAKLEKIFEQHSTPLHCIGVASNGEAFYRKAN